MVRLPFSYINLLLTTTVSKRIIPIPKEGASTEKAYIKGTRTLWRKKGLNLKP